MIGFEQWLRSVCFQKPTPEAKDLAQCAWDTQQGKIDSLMLEYCQDEMTADQLGRYSECQRIVSE